MRPVNLLENNSGDDEEGLCLHMNASWACCVYGKQKVALFVGVLWQSGAAVCVADHVFASVQLLETLKLKRELCVCVYR